MKIYIVQGTTGEYSDSSDWLVCAYAAERDAEEHARRAMLRAMEIHKKGRYSSWDENREINEYDPDMLIDYTGTEYTIFSVDLREKFEPIVPDNLSTNP